MVKALVPWACTVELAGGACAILPILERVAFASNHEAGAARPTSRTAYLPIPLPPPLDPFSGRVASLSLSLSFRSFFEVRERVSPPYDGHTDISHFRELCTCLSMAYGRWLSAGEGSEPEREMVEALAGSLYEKSSIFSERGDKGENVGRRRLRRAQERDN